MAQTFEKNAAKKRCQELLQRPGTRISLQSGDGAFLMQLLQRHHHAEQKKGCGITHFTVECSSVGGFKPAPHFVLHRKDGSSTDFSYNKCINSKPPAAAAAGSSTTCASSSGSSSKSRTSSSMLGCSTSTWELSDHFIYMALRKAVYNQTHAVKVAALGRCNVAVNSGNANPSQAGQHLGPPKCPITGVTMTWDNARTDHAGSRSFKQLVQGWLQQQRNTLSKVVLTTGDNTVGSTMADASQMRSWQQYHQQHAVLRLVSEAGHKQLTAQQNRQNSQPQRGGGRSSSSSRSARRQPAQGAAAPAGSVDEVAAQLAQLQVQHV